MSEEKSLVQSPLVFSFCPCFASTLLTPFWDLQIEAGKRLIKETMDDVGFTEIYSPLSH